jgi:hypothetical protein
LKYTGCCFYPTLSSTCCSVIKTCLCSQELQLSMKNKLRSETAWVMNPSNASNMYVGQEWYWREN